MLKKLRESVPEKLEGVCGRCILKYFCMGECVAENYVRERSLTAPFYFCKEAYDQGIFPETRLIDERVMHEAVLSRHS